MSDKIVLVCDGTPAIGAAIRKSITDKEKVLAKWPDARCRLMGGASDFKYQIWSNPVTKHVGEISTKQTTQKAAWADAARRLEGGK